METLYLKWGSYKWHSDLQEPARNALQAYFDHGEHQLSAMAHKDTPTQRDLLCAVIDAVQGRIVNDWSGEEMTAEQAKAYVMEYDT